jgi:hypothetical protein
MPDIHDVIDVTMEELSPEQQVQLKDAIDQFQQKCLMSFAKNRSGVPYLKSDMPRVLLPGEPDATSAEEKQEVMNAVQQTMESIMAKHNTAFLEYVPTNDGWCLWPKHGKGAWSSITPRAYCGDRRIKCCCQ